MADAKVENCKSCKYAAPYQGPDGRIDWNLRSCHGGPPQAILMPGAQGVMLSCVWPTVKASDYCRCFENREGVMAVPYAMPEETSKRIA